MDLCKLPLLAESEIERIVVDRYSDSLLTLNNPQVNGEHVDCSLSIKYLLRFFENRPSTLRTRSSENSGRNGLVVEWQKCMLVAM